MDEHVRRPADLSVLVLNYNGKQHLERCLDACSKLDRQGIDLKLVCIDNASADGSVDVVRERFPSVRLIVNERNLGFARAYNEAITAVESEWVALLNNDAIPDPGWLVAALDAAVRHRADCVGSRISKDGGKRIDFVGASMNFYGHGFHPHFEEPSTYLGEEGPTLFASGGAMLCRRSTFLESGGFDDKYFAYFEDVDLGWRFNLLGVDVIYAPASHVVHAHGATTRHIPPYKKRAWLERNGLFSVIKNYDERRLARVLPVALALAAERAVLNSGINPDRSFFEEQPDRRAALNIPPRQSRSSRARKIVRERGVLAGSLHIARRVVDRFNRPLLRGEWVAMDRRGFSSLAALDAVIWDAPGLHARRLQVQRARRRPDDAVVTLFHDTFRPSFPEPELRHLQDALVAAFAINELF